MSNKVEEFERKAPDFSPKPGEFHTVVHGVRIEYPDYPEFLKKIDNFETAKSIQEKAEQIVNNKWYTPAPGNHTREEMIASIQEALIAIENGDYEELDFNDRFE